MTHFAIRMDYDARPWLWLEARPKKDHLVQLVYHLHACLHTCGPEAWIKANPSIGVALANPSRIEGIILAVEMIIKGHSTGRINYFWV